MIDLRFSIFQTVLKSLFFLTAVTTGLLHMHMAALAAPKVVTTISPVHSLVSSVMKDIGEPVILIEGNASPHGFRLKPSQAALLQQADLVFWIGPALESGLGKSLESLAVNAQVISLLDVEGMAHIKLAQPHHHGEGEEEEEHQDAHADGHEDGHEHEEDHGHEDAENHAETGLEPHIWLNPDNAVAMVNSIEKALITADPENRADYARNANNTRSRLENLKAELESVLSGVQGRPFLTFHDGYRHFTTRFNLDFEGAITLDPEHQMSAGKLRELQKHVSEHNIACIFSEPQFGTKVIDVLIPANSGKSIKSGVLDPLGVNQKAGPDAYFLMMENLAKSFQKCLG